MLPHGRHIYDTVRTGKELRQQMLGRTTEGGYLCNKANSLDMERAIATAAHHLGLTIVWSEKGLNATLQD